MKLLGVTGGIGMGKTTVADLLRRRSVAVIDTDVLARELVEPGQPAWEEIKARFGPTVVDPAGHLRREVLAARVFRDEAERQGLEEILHPRIRRAWMEAADGWRQTGVGRGAVVIPLLYETGAEGAFDAVMCVACREVTQRARLRARGWSDEQIRDRLAAQWPTHRKMAPANFVVWTEGDLESVQAQLDLILQA